MIFNLDLLQQDDKIGITVGESHFLFCSCTMAEIEVLSLTIY